MLQWWLGWCTVHIAAFWHGTSGDNSMGRHFVIVQKLRWQVFGFFHHLNPLLRWQFLPYKSWHFWTAYPPLVVNVVCERPLLQMSNKPHWVRMQLLSEALILASTNPQYDNRLFIELYVQYMKITSSEHVLYKNWFFVFVLTFRTIYVHNILSL